MGEEDNASLNVHTDRKKQQPNEEEEETLKTEDILEMKIDIQKLRTNKKKIFSTLIQSGVTEKIDIFSRMSQDV